jgi:DNA-binding transcriptional LysR family regulator
MTDLNALVIFAKVVEANSFSEAACPFQRLAGEYLS